MLPRQYLSSRKRLGSHTIKFDPNNCFISGCCIEITEEELLHEVMSKELDARFRWYTTYMSNTERLTKLVGGDLIALDAKYHNHCALTCRICVRYKLRKNNPTMSQNNQKYEHKTFFD